MSQPGSAAGPAVATRSSRPAPHQRRPGSKSGASPYDSIDASGCDFSEKLSRKVLSALRSLNDSLGEVRQSVAKIDFIAHGSPAPAAGGGPAASTGSPIPEAAAARGLVFSPASAASAGADKEALVKTASSQQNSGAMQSLLFRVAMASAEAGAALDPETEDSLQKMLSPEAFQRVQAARSHAQQQSRVAHASDRSDSQSAAVPPPAAVKPPQPVPGPSGGSAAPSAPGAESPSSASGAAASPSGPSPASSKDRHAQTPASPDYHHERRSPGMPDGSPDDRGTGPSAGSFDDASSESEVLLEEVHMSEVQFFAQEQEAAERRAAKAKLMQFKAEHDREKGLAPADEPSSSSTATAGAGGAHATPDKKKPDGCGVGDAEWPMVSEDPVGPSDRSVKYEAFNLRIVYEAGRTGFEEMKEFEAPIDSLIAGRYLVRDFLGSAAFSTALSCEDLHTGRDVCLKVIKNNKDYLDQSLDEIKLLRYINSQGNPDDHNVLRMYEYFYHKEHLFLVTELLKDNLYEFQKYLAEADEPPYFTLPRLQRIAIQTLEALVFIHDLGLIHCDLKPENILIKSYSRCEIKVIDFGSSCYVTDHLSSYIQSRSYRGPEVILGCPYGPKIDIWSFGCILAELLTGRVLFQNESIQSMLARMIGVIGDFPEHMVQGGSDSAKYFTSRGIVYERTEDGSSFVLLQPKRTSLKERLKGADEGFVSFVSSLLTLDPDKRPTAREALEHPWLKQEYELTPYALPQ